MLKKAYQDMITSAALIFLLCTQSIQAYLPLNYRSQSDSAEREIIGITQYINKAVDYYYGVFASTLQYTLSFAPNSIADTIFESNLRSPTLSALDITGSGVTTRGCNNWLADYFGLPIDFNSTVRVAPSIANCILDLYWYFGLNNIVRGLYATINAPIVSTHWTLNYFEAVNKFGQENYAPGYFNQIATGDNVGVYRTDLLHDFTDFVFHEQAPDLGDLVSFAPLEVSKMTPKKYRCNKTKTALSDIQATIGWNVILNRWYHLGIGLRIGLPTGNTSNAQYIFSPLIGNNKHWQAGAQLWGHYTFYVSENEEKQWMIYGLANITHLFNRRECRVFDLRCKVNSRWMLAEKLTPHIANLQAAILPDDVTPSNLVTPSAQFANRYSPVANLTQRSINSSYGIQCDAVVMLSYMHRHFNVDFGYNSWYRSKEHITKICDQKTPLTTQLWALKGDSYVFGFTSDLNPSVTADIPVALSATQSKATIRSGTNNFVSDDLDQGGIDGVRPTRNPGIDNPLFAAATFSGNSTTVNDRTTSFMGEQTHTSYNPIYITEDQLDMCTDNTQGLSNKIFVYFNHLWADAPYNKPVPYLGSGLELEWGSGYAVSQWGVWLKGGFYFN